MAERLVYCVFEEGVYRHRCFGVFSSLKLAEAAAHKADSKASDDYHNYSVVPFTIDHFSKTELDECAHVAGTEKN